ncbi:hypothetical protein [Atlantibacter sp.]|uniref:hypothetical protein n=1 Tax=Atlantibacter sp. TaxID=1903473 RepID=UPI0028AA2321|nr:hypothetical protein [Atlantibacter sp.]
MKKTGLLIFSLMLAGCASTQQTAPKSLVTPAPVQADVIEPQPPAVTTNGTSLTANETCTKSLAALQTYNPRSWDKYSREMSELTSKTSQFLSVKEDLNPQTNQLVMSVYASRTATLCYRIESALGQAMIEQAAQLGN